MPRHKKTFSCGHKGYGRSCHSCFQQTCQQEQIQLAIHQKQQAKLEWDATFRDDRIDLRGLPKYVVLKARTVIARLGNGQNYREFRGKRLRHDRHLISIPLTRDYRMICQDTSNGILPKAVVSHEDYNVSKPGA